MNHLDEVRDEIENAAIAAITKAVPSMTGRDTIGLARAIVRDFNSMGVVFKVGEEDYQGFVDAAPDSVKEGAVAETPRDLYLFFKGAIEGRRTATAPLVAEKVIDGVQPESQG